jgi:predicted acylesterase/phospholipase RssA
MPKMALVLQGGGALGAYEYGAVCRLVELGWEPVAVAGVSIGAATAAAIAGAREGDICASLRHLVGGYNPFAIASLAGRQTGNALDIRQSGLLASSLRFTQLHTMDELV